MSEPSSPDISAELKEAADALGSCEPGYISSLMRRARVEITALRRTIRLGPDLPAIARAEALEEAAQLCKDRGFGETASAILALRDKTTSAIRAENIAMSEERTTSPNDGAAEG